MAVAAIAVALRAPDSASKPHAIPLSAPWNRHALWSVVCTRGVLLISLTNAVLAAVQTGTIVFLLPLYLAERGSLQPVAVGYLVGISVLGRLAALWLVGNASDRHDRTRLLVLGLMGYGVSIGSLTAVSGAGLLALWSLLIGAGAGFVAGLPTAIMADRIAPELHGIGIGWLRTVTDAGMLIGPVVMGVLADAVDLSAPFLFAALLAGVLAWWCHREAVVVQSAPGSGG
jgi:MFS family permease